MSSASASRKTICRLGDARPNSRKLRWRWDISARLDSSSCDNPRRCRHHRSFQAKVAWLFMTTSEVVADTMAVDKMAHLIEPAHRRFEWERRSGY
jgi:hypothetical protein